MPANMRPVKRDGCLEKWKANKNCNKPLYRVACKKFVVNRDCLTQAEHLELLATAKGYSWEETRGRSYVQRLCKRSEELRGRHTAKPKKDEQAMWREFVKQFLRTAKDSLSPMLKAMLPKILLAQNMSDPKWSKDPNPPAELCRFLSDLKPQCDSDKWKRDFKKKLSSLIFDYIVYVHYFDRMTEEKKTLRSEISKILEDITQKNGFPEPSPKNNFKELQTFLAKILAPWLVKSAADFCKDAHTDLPDENKVVKNNYDEQRPNENRFVGNDSNRKYFRPGDKKTVESRDGQENKLKTGVKRKSNRIEDVDETNDDVSANNNLMEETRSKANDGLINENGFKAKTVAKTAGKTKRNHGDAVKRSGPNEKDAKKKSAPSIRKNTESSGVRRNGDESKDRAADGLKKRHGRKAGTIGEKSRTSVNEKLESLNNDDALHDNNKRVTKAIQEHSANEKPKVINAIIRIEKDRENNNTMIDTDRRKNGKIIRDKSEALNDEAIKRDNTSNGAKSKTMKKMNSRKDKPASKSKIIHKRKKLNSGSKTPKSSKVKDEESSDPTKRRFNEENRLDQYGKNGGSIDAEKPPLGSQTIYNNNTASLDVNNDETNEEKGYVYVVNENRLENDEERNDAIDRNRVNRGEAIVDRIDDPDNDNGNNDDTGKSLIADNAIALDDDDNDAEKRNYEFLSKDSTGEKSKGKFHGTERDTIDTDRGNRGGIIIVEDSKQSSAESSEENERESSDHQLNYTRCYHDVNSNDDEFASFVTNSTYEFFNRSLTNSYGRITQKSSDSIYRLNEPGCYERFVKSAREAMADEMKNKVSTDLKDSDNQNAGIMYQICKKEDSDYSVRKTVLPIRKNSDPTNPGCKRQCKTKWMAGELTRKYVLDIGTGELEEVKCFQEQTKN